MRRAAGLGPPLLGGLCQRAWSPCQLQGDPKALAAAAGLAWRVCSSGGGDAWAAQRRCVCSSSASVSSPAAAAAVAGAEAGDASSSGGAAASTSGRGDGGGGAGGSSGSNSDQQPLRPPGTLGGGKRFYKTARVERAEGGEPGWQVLLDKYPVRTPARRPLVVPSYPLALALAAEWEWLPSGKPVLHAMPLMSLAATAIDQPKPRERVISDLLKFAHTDAACVRYEPGPLATRQAKTFDPLLAWARAELGWDLAASDDIAGPTQSPEAVAAVRRYLEGLDPWRLAAAEQLASALKSLVLSAALLAGRLAPAAALEASRLEEAFQIEDWGMVEAGHDLDIADLATRVAAPSVLARLLPAAAEGQAARGW